MASRYPPPPRAPVGHPRAESGRALQRQRRVPMRGQRGLLGRSPARRAIPKRASACARAQGRSLVPCSRAAGPATVAAAACLHAVHRPNALPSLHRSGGPRVTRAAVEWHGLNVWCGCASAAACGAIGRRSPGQPVALTSSSGLRRAQQANIGADSCAARAGPPAETPQAPSGTDLVLCRATTGPAESKSLTSHAAPAGTVFIRTTTTGSSLVHFKLYCVPACAALRLGCETAGGIQFERPPARLFSCNGKSFKRNFNFRTGQRA